MSSATELEGPQRARPRRIAGVVRLAFELAVADITRVVARRHPELRAAHLQVFGFGSIEGRRVTDLATRAAMTKQSMHELIGYLQSHGYLTREPDPDDERARLIRLTARGRELEDAVQVAAARLHLSWRDRVGAERFDVMWSALQDIVSSTDPPPDEASLRCLAQRLVG